MESLQEEGVGGGLACFHFHPPPGRGIGKCPHRGYAGWHTFGADWEPGVITYYYDGIEVGQVSSVNIDSTPQYLVMDLFQGDTHGQPLAVPSEILIDYVRVWQRSLLPTSSTWAFENTTGANINAFYKGAGGELADGYWIPTTGWANPLLAGGVAGP
jgi:hypothetical protein